MPSLSEDRNIGDAESMFNRLKWELERQGVYGFPESWKAAIQYMMFKILVDHVSYGLLRGFRINDFYVDPMTEGWRWDIDLFYPEGVTLKFPWYRVY